MKYFTEEPHVNFTKDSLGKAEGSTATQGFAQTVQGKIAMGLRVKYFMNFVLFYVAIVTYVLYGLVLTWTSLFVLKVQTQWLDLPTGSIRPWSNMHFT